MNKAEALEYLLGTTCSACGGGLPGPGEPCQGCGRIPDITGPELADELDGPVALAAVEAVKLRNEAWAMHDAAVAKMAEADRVLFTAGLEVRRGEAQRMLEAHQRQHKALYGPRTAARKAEDKAAAELETAAGQHAEIASAEEVARRMRLGVAIETEAAIKVGKATEILRRYQGDLAGATARREQAEAAVEASAARGAMLERARDEAVAAVANPGRIPLRGETVTMGGLRLVLSGELDDVEMVIAGQTARLVCAATGVTSEIEMEVRRQVAAEAEKEKRDRPMYVQPLGTSGDVRAIANPLSAATPMPWAPRAPGSNPHPVQPAMTSHLGS
jgi:hypothetical protein